MKYSHLLVLVLLLLCASCNIPKDDDKSLFINENVDNRIISEVYQDTVDFGTKDIYAVRHYKLPTEGKSWDNTKTFHNQSFGLVSYTEYLPDGRILLKEGHSRYGSASNIDRYYYSDDWKRPILKEQVRKTETQYSWLSYDADSILSECFSYQLDAKNNFLYKNYSTYSADSVDDGVVVKFVEYDSDTLISPTKTYTFSYPFLTFSSSDDTISYHKKELLNGKYKLVEVLEKDDYDGDKEFKIWYRKDGFSSHSVSYRRGEPKSQTEFSYSEDFKEQIESVYYDDKREENMKTLCRYDDHHNLIFHQMSSGETAYGIDFYEYVYDERGNWIERKKYFLLPNEVKGDKELSTHEVREIEYYKPDQQPKARSLPAYASQADDIKQQIPQLAQKKQDGIDAYSLVVEVGDFDRTITTTVADSISDFTPKHWTVEEVVYGDLDGLEGDEAVVVYKTPMSNEYDSNFRCLAILKQEDGEWTLWHQSFAPLMGTKDGGMMGDPFMGIDIKNRAIVIKHYGGSRFRWGCTHRYRFQDNDWYLIGVTSGGGALGEEFKSIDYNLSTGIAICEHSIHEFSDEGESIEIEAWEETVEVDSELPLMDDKIFGGGGTIVSVRGVDFAY